LENFHSEPRKLKQFGGILFGILLGLMVNDSIMRGASFVFPNEKDLWGVGFWSDHHFLRIIASGLGTLVGAFAAGCIAKSRGGGCGFLSALPTSLFWLSIVLLHFGSRITDTQITVGQWLVIVVLTVISPLAGFYAGLFGQKVRNDFAPLFETRPNTVLGIKWYHWLWFFTAIGWTGTLATYSIYQGLWLLLLFWLGFSASLFNITAAILGIIVILSIFYSIFGLYKTFILLSLGQAQGLSRSKMTIRVLGWTVGIWLVVVLLQIVAGLLFSKYMTST
jgi:hypothetical protein